MATVAYLAAKLDVRYANAAAVAFMTWNAVIYVGIEVEHMWSGPGSWVKWMYAFMRYFPIFHGIVVFTLNGPLQHVLSPDSCRAWLTYQLVFMEVLTIVTEIVLTLRIYFLYNGNKIVLWAIIIAFVAEVSTMIVALCLSLPKITFGAKECLISHTPSFYMTYWISSLIFEAFLFGLTLFAFSRSVMRDLGRHSVLFVFVRDGTWAFAMIFVSMLFNTLMYKLCPNARAGIGYLWAGAVMSFAGSQVLLNVRATLRDRRGTYTTSFTTDLELTDLTHKT